MSRKKCSLAIAIAVGCESNGVGVITSYMRAPTMSFTCVFSLHMHMTLGIILLYLSARRESKMIRSHEEVNQPQRQDFFSVSDNFIVPSVPASPEAFFSSLALIFSWPSFFIFHHFSFSTFSFLFSRNIISTITDTIDINNGVQHRSSSGCARDT